MAGLVNGVFRPKVSKYLRQLIKHVQETEGEDSGAYKALVNQYVYSEKEEEKHEEVNLKHYEAIVEEDDSKGLPKGIERLYRRQLVIDITMVCAAHCRYCLRAYYDTSQLKKSDIDRIVEYCAKDINLKEVLVTGGDPFMVPNLLKYLITTLVEKAPNIKVVRIGTRVPVQEPKMLNDEMFSFLKNYSKSLMIEVAIQINHPIELQPVTLEILRKLQDSGVRIYSQNVLLKDVNDDIDTLITLYDELRYLGIEAHYLFHSIPMKGTNHLRTSVAKGLKLIKQLTSSGMISGRVKPTYALMTYIGKVTLYDGTILKKDDSGYLHIKTNYRVSDRQIWNETYQLPKDQAYEDEDGFIIAKYLDGDDHTHIAVNLIDGDK
ncbi:radical SAM protein [Shewanella eurypsychrophilus]|uniref:Radical SAM protein n=1 Tax=Shewanella eurypsychrophilus TaxID=2593656 RepID=A0ABX6V7Z1_9GAMM|nr:MULTISPECIES: radical SAM protein [Shewanella]QFU23531.1 radical SAM protein [Shewanella sp. YLB-09]QPG58757.1 radical SAM protein [Shewanella eurypsychrophilus]